MPVEQIERTAAAIRDAKAAGSAPVHCSVFLSNAAAATRACAQQLAMSSGWELIDLGAQASVHHSDWSALYCIRDYLAQIHHLLWLTPQCHCHTPAQLHELFNRAPAAALTSTLTRRHCWEAPPPGEPALCPGHEWWLAPATLLRELDWDNMQGQNESIPEGLAVLSSRLGLPMHHHRFTAFSSAAAPLVVVALWDRMQNIEPIAQALSRQTHSRFELLLWNNNPHHGGALERIVGQFPMLQAQLHHSPVNRFGFGRFLGARLASGEPLIFFDDDQIPHPDFLEYMLEMHSLFGPKAIIGWWRRIFVPGELYGDSFHEAQIPPYTEVDYVGTGGMAVSRAVILDERIQSMPDRFQFIEDLYLSFAARTSLGCKNFGLERRLEHRSDEKDLHLGLHSIKDSAVLEFIGHGWELELHNTLVPMATPGCRDEVSREEASREEASPKELSQRTHSVPSPQEPRSSSKLSLAMCLVFRNEAPYLQEWIEFHRIVGAERFYLYDNRSTDGVRSVLAPYIEEGIVEYHYWPEPLHPHRNGPMRYRLDCCHRHQSDTQWIAFLDADEFLVPARPDETIAAALKEFESFPGVGLVSLPFGPNGAERWEPGLVIERFTRRQALGSLEIIKTIAQPSRVLEAPNPHYFLYTDSDLAVDERRRPIVGSQGRIVPPGHERAFVSDASWDRLRVHHYITKSREEYEHLKKLKDQPHEPHQTYTDTLFQQYVEEANEVEDLTALRYREEILRRCRSRT